MYIQRHAQEAVAKLSEMFGALLVAGPRQVGKTTMLRNIMASGDRKVSYVTLDDPMYLASAVEQSMTFFKDNPPPVFIDEVQKASELFPQIKMLIDRERKKGQFYLCGSQQFQMMKNVDESLAGRLGMLMLLGSEILKSYYNKGILDPPLYFYREKDKKEIDLLIEENNTLHPMHRCE